MIEDGLRVDANCYVSLYDSNGKLKEYREIHNTVTTAGKEGVADQVLDTPTLPKMGWMAVGTGTPTATLLGAEISRVAFSTKVRSGAVVTVNASWGAGVGTGALTEAGTFDVVTANTVNMWMSATFAVVNKLAEDTLVITWTLTAS